MTFIRSKALWALVFLVSGHGVRAQAPGIEFPAASPAATVQQGVGLTDFRIVFSRPRGNLEITSGTGRRVACVTQARLCRCGGSATKPFCDGTHTRIGFRST
jgi:CDGSH-type Zn-finger protein